LCYGLTTKSRLPVYTYTAYNLSLFIRSCLSNTQIVIGGFSPNEVRLQHRHNRPASASRHRNVETSFTPIRHDHIPSQGHVTMSFGYSVCDFLAVGQLTWTVIAPAKELPVSSKNCPANPLPYTRSSTSSKTKPRRQRPSSIDEAPPAKMS